MLRFLNIVTNVLVIGFALLAFLYHNQDFGLELIIFKLAPKYKSERGIR